jgi:4-amino-4-deoxy-L-arabinose transferase-like glycosyltransferase
MNLFKNPLILTLSLILLLALSVRLLGINYGFPYVLYPDEAVIVNHAMAFGTGDLNPHSFFYPSLYMYLLFIFYGITYVGGGLLGVFGSTDDFIRLFFTDATIFYLPGRLIAAFSGVASVWMVYKLGRRAYNAQAGLISAAILAFSVLHVSYSHYVKTHVPAGFLVIVTVWLAWSIYQGQNSWRRYCLAGATAGLAASTVYHAGFTLIAVVVAHWLCSRKVRLLDRKLMAAVAASFAAFVLTTPFAVLDWPTFLSDLSSSAAMRYSGNFWASGTFYPFTSLLSTFGQPVGGVALLGVGYAILRHRPADLIVASQPILVGLFLMLFRVKESTHMLVAFPAISILAASLIVDATSWIFRRRLTSQAVAVATVTGFLIAWPALKSFRASYRLSLPDTRILAKSWVEKNIPPGSKIVMDSGKYYLGAFGPPLTLSRWTLEQLIHRGRGANSRNIARRVGTRRVAYAGEAAYFQYQLDLLGDRPGYDIVQILHDIGSPKIEWPTLDYYTKQGVQYAIVSSYALDNNYESKDLYEAFRRQATLIKEFRPSEKIGGPALFIYRLR